MTHMRLFGWLRHARPTVTPPSDIDDRVRALERDSKQLRLEWEDTYEQLHSVARKLAKREKRDAVGESPVEQPDIAPVAGEPSREALRAVARARGLIR